MNNRYQVRTTDKGRYQIQRSRDGDKFKDLWTLWIGDDSYVYPFLWMAKLDILHLIRKDKRSVRQKASADKIVYGPKPEKKRPLSLKGPSA